MFHSVLPRSAEKWNALQAHKAGHFIKFTFSNFVNFLLSPGWIGMSCIYVSPDAISNPGAVIAIRYGIVGVSG